MAQLRSKLISGAMCVAIAGSSCYAGSNYMEAFFYFELTAPQGSTFNITDHFVKANAISVVFQSCCPSQIPLDQDVEVDTTNAIAGSFVGGMDCGNSRTDSSSIFTGLSPTKISWFGSIITSVDFFHCNDAQPSGGGGAGFIVDFTTTGSFDAEPPTCPSVDVDAQLGRAVTANIVCIDGSNNAVIASSVTSISGTYVLDCASPVTLGSGAYTATGSTIWIMDDYHDVTGDSRFNELDAVFLQSIVGTAAASDLLYTHRFDYNNTGAVDQNDVDEINKFIDAGLSSGIFGDTNKDGVVDCCDLAGYDAAYGSSFDTASTPYLVELDWDLDGDIDAVDQAEFNDIACIADINNDHVLDIFDTYDFVALFNAGDLSVDFYTDGILDIFDTLEFIDAFNTTCP